MRKCGTTVFKQRRFCVVIGTPVFEQRVGNRQANGRDCFTVKKNYVVMVMTVLKQNECVDMVTAWFKKKKEKEIYIYIHVAPVFNAFKKVNKLIWLQLPRS